MTMTRKNSDGSTTTIKIAKVYETSSHGLVATWQDCGRCTTTVERIGRGTYKEII